MYLTLADLVLSVVVAIGVKEYAQASEVVLATKYRASLPLLLGVPEGKAVSKQVFTLTVDLELNHHLPVVHTNWLQVHRQR